MKSCIDIYTYMYHKVEAVNSGTHACSLVYKNLEQLGIIKEWDESDENHVIILALIFGNCGDQNKNHTSIYLSIWLVNIGLYGEVKIVF